MLHWWTRHAENHQSLTIDERLFLLEGATSLARMATQSVAFSSIYKNTTPT